ncbi:hypothetical protein CFK37_17815 [Virgibacillus phasianinus]|uniref:Uncharacterized protein n=1 Tax=Virgibacillus phasianinus TaxID=2017483 RepID=A0A220U7D2_9BACI|nr:DUF3231 family protein [Virgibacillus phasianinus]ASK63882.1 hypothetical protein CFK37_17815 [Virgibacillus phasianinus]
MTNIPLSSTELGNLWQAYQEKSMKLHFLKNFIKNSNDKEVRSILQFADRIETENKKAIETIFRDEGVAIPVAFTGKDIDSNAPRLFDDHFHLMFIRMLSKILIGLYGLHSGMSYREDIYKLYNHFTSDSQTIYNKATQCLLKNNALARPPKIQMPDKVEFVQDTSYTSGLNPFGKKRALNSVEIGLVYQALEANITGIQMMTGFARVAENPEVKQYFERGKELAEKVISIMGGVLEEDGLQKPSPWSGVVSDSPISPFSDKIMMYTTNLLSMFGMGSNSVGAAFSFRNDLLLKMGQIMANTFDFAKDGGKIIIKQGWMEKPPHAADRTDPLKE